MKGRVHGLYGIADVSGAPGRTEFEVAEAFLDAGVSVLQLRMKGAPEAAIAAVLEALVPRCADAGCSLLVNDHVGLAARFGIGVHLGQDDADPAGARDAVGPDVLVGWSTHDARDVERAARLPVDYVGFGPVFSAAGKHRAAGDDRAPMSARGLAALAAVVATATVPVVAIGGIDADNLADVLDAGAAAAAVISAVAAAPDPRVAARRLASIASGRDTP